MPPFDRLNFTPIDTELETLKLRRDTVLVVPSFHATLVAAKYSQLIATIQQMLSGVAEAMLASSKSPCRSNDHKFPGLVFAL